MEFDRMREMHTEMTDLLRRLGMQLDKAHLRTVKVEEALHHTITVLLGRIHQSEDVAVIVRELKTKGIVELSGVPLNAFPEYGRRQ